MPDAATSPDPAWVSARHFQHILRQAGIAGVPAETLLEAAGLPRTRLQDADGIIPLSAVEQLLAALDRHPAGIMAGLRLAQDIEPATFGALGLLLQSCTTLAEALEALVRFNGLLSNIGTTSLAFGPGSVTLNWHCTAGSPAFRRHATEYVLGSFVVFARLLLPDHAELPRAVHFVHAQPAGTDARRDYFSFFRCPVFFGEATSGVTIPAGLLNARLPHGDAALNALLQQHTLNLLQARSHPSRLQDDVRRLILVMMSRGIPTRDLVARQLGTSERSLHRHLQEAGTSFRALLDDARLDVARQQLAEGTNTVSDVAERLGFGSHQAFLRWFKHLTGMTPGEFRSTLEHFS